MKSENVRASTCRRCLRNILVSPGGLRAGLSLRTGMTRATISRLVDDLVGAGLVREVEPGDGGGRAARPTASPPAEGSAAALGVEVDVTSLDIMLVDLAGRELGHRRIERDLADSAPEETIALAAERPRCSKKPCLTVPSSWAWEWGCRARVADRLALALNLGWQRHPARSAVPPLADLNPIVVANEADLAAYAVTPRVRVCHGPSTLYRRVRWGGRGVSSITRPMSGARAWSGEIGHMCRSERTPAAAGRGIPRKACLGARPSEHGCSQGPGRVTFALRGFRRRR